MQVYKVKLLYPEYGAEVKQFNELQNAVHYATEIATNFPKGFVNIYLAKIDLRDSSVKSQKVVGVAHFEEKIKQVCVKAPWMRGDR